MATTRKLAVTVFVDVVNYTATMGRDERAALRPLEELHKILYPLVQNHDGMVLKEPGDGALMIIVAAWERHTNGGGQQ